MDDGVERNTRTIEDTVVKLEYDLYYMKHMSLFLDLFILLDTVRIVLCGGVQEDPSKRTTRVKAVMEWERLKTEHAATLAQPLAAASRS